MAKQTPFYEIHQQLGAKIIDFGGFDMPVQYAGIRKEHMAVREQAGIFDVSHMGEFFVSGPQASDLIQYVTLNDVNKLYPGRAQYSGMCYENGGMVDDLLVYMLDEQKYMLVVNAANKDKDLNWINSCNTFEAKVEDHSDDMCLLAVQGPAAPEIVNSLSSIDTDAIKFYHFDRGECAGASDVIISATGYTGEKGFELYFDKNQNDAHQVWNKMMEAGKPHGLEPAGLGARDTLRLEFGLALYGNDITEETNPIEAGLGWITKLEKGEFIGKPAIQKVKDEGPKRKLIGFEMQEPKKIPRKGYNVQDSSGRVVGEVTSGGLSIVLDRGIGMAYVETELAQAETNVAISIRNKPVDAVLKKPPFIKKK